MNPEQFNSLMNCLGDIKALLGLMIIGVWVLVILVGC